MIDRDRIDPESRVPIDALIGAIPGGFNAIPDIVARRAMVAGMMAAAAVDVPPNDRVEVSDRTIPGGADNPDNAVRIYRPAGAVGVLPGVLYIHGGGMIMGDLDAEHLNAIRLTEAVGAVIVSVDYRKAPEFPFPAAPDDCYAGLLWLSANAADLGVDPERIAVYGGSAGGGLALAVTLMARDRRGPAIKHLMAIYPMIDDSNTTSSSQEVTDIGLWDRAGNIEAWQWYLGDAHGSDEVSPYAAPARAEDLRGLPPTFVDVGTLDLFRDEDIAFVARLNQAGVPTEFHLYPGAYHASEVFAPEAELSQRIWATRISALQRALA